MKLAEAKEIVEELLSTNNHHLLWNHLTKFVVCGSIRREQPEVHDIDIVAIPRPESEYAFGEMSLKTTITKIDPDGRNLPNDVKRFVLGDKLMRFMYKGIIIDLYLANKKTFETLRLIRTGSKEHNLRLTTLAIGKGMKLKASGDGLCVMMPDDPEKISHIVEDTEDGILMNLLNHIPKPENRN